MDTAATLVRIYLFIYQRYRGQLAAVVQWQGNNSDLTFTDEDVLTIYVFGFTKNRRTASGIHQASKLPSYQGVLVHTSGRLAMHIDGSLLRAGD